MESGWNLDLDQIREIKVVLTVSGVCFAEPVFSLCLGVGDILFQSPRMETEGYLETQRNREVQNDKIRPPSNEMVAEESEVVLISAPQVQVPREPSGLPPESLDEDSVEDLETMPRRNRPNAAASRQRFRKFRYEDAAGPREVLRHLQELAGQWLRPDIHTKEQIVEMLVQEQFQAVLPEELRARAQRCQPGVRITG